MRSRGRRPFAGGSAMFAAWLLAAFTACSGEANLRSRADRGREDGTDARQRGTDHDVGARPAAADAGLEDVGAPPTFADARTSETLDGGSTNLDADANAPTPG